MRMGADSASFPNVSELQVRIDVVFMRLHRLDAIDVAVGEPTRLVSEWRQLRDGGGPTQVRLLGRRGTGRPLQEHAHAHGPAGARRYRGRD